MTVDAPHSGFVSLTTRLRDVLLETGQLAPEDARRVEDVMRSRDIGFEEAALELGLLTHEDLAAATLLAARELAPQLRDEFIRSTIRGFSATRNLPVKYVGIVKAGPSLNLLHDPDSAYSEQIRALRTELVLNNDRADRGSSIAVLSAVQNEGRTQLCAEMAIAFAQLGKRTLLVDADLRRPRIHELFESKNNIGLGQALKLGSAPVLLEVDRLPHLCLSIAGDVVPNPLELLTNGHLQTLMSDWRMEFDMVIIDTPPVSEFADGLAIAAFAEQVLIVAREGLTPHKNMKEMLRRMAATQSKIVGSVIHSF